MVVWVLTAVWLDRLPLEWVVVGAAEGGGGVGVEIGVGIILPRRFASVKGR